MAITIDVHFDSAVIDANMDIFVKSYIEDETTIIEFDTRKRNYKKLFGIKSRIKWGKEEYGVCPTFFTKKLTMRVASPEFLLYRYAHLLHHVHEIFDCSSWRVKHGYHYRCPF